MRNSDDMRRLLRLYAVTDRGWLRGMTLGEQVEQAILGGATMVQLREKDMHGEALLAEAKAIRAICHRHGVPLLIDDDVEIARLCGADGVHVGQDDMRCEEALRVLGAEAIIGVTAKTIEQARRAQAAGADYLGSGAVFGTSTKPNAKPMTRETLSSIAASVDIPVVAIGGINRGNIEQLAGTGIAGVAVVSGIFAAEDIGAECRALRAIAGRICAP